MINKKKDVKKYLIKRIILLNLGSLGIVVFTYLWMVFFLASVNSFWDLFRNKDIYEVKDTVAPVSPYLEPIPEAIKEDKTTIYGKSEPGIKIVMYIDNSQQSETITDNEGGFSFSDIPIGYAISNIKVIAEDNSGNKSTDSKSYSIVRDITAPEIEILSPKSGETYKATERTYAVTGKTEAGINVLVEEQSAILNSEGEFTAQVSLNDGGNEILIKAIDKAGNETEKKVFMTYEKIQ
ncbi:MAG: hypothetical protein QG570_172 [Patescibacteria group bacterium]|nr:hypothetical protein [Patescibacteria group bacterium]